MNIPGGFYTVNKLSDKLKEGGSFKEGDILAVDEKFFTQLNPNEAVYKGGHLTKIALTSGFYTYEDSGACTNHLSEQLTTDVSMKEQFVLGKNSNIEFFAKRGQHIEVGDPLLVFDESYSDESINKLLASLSAENRDTIESIGRVPLKAKHSGVIADIKIYYTVEKDQLSPSLQKFIDEINKPLIQRERAITKNTKIETTSLVLEPTHKVEAKYGKVKGTDVGEGILIEFHINHDVGVGIGDKLIMMNALKFTVGLKIEPGMEPYSEFRPDEEVSAFLSPISFLARMTDSILNNGWGNKVLIETKRKMQEIYES
jgi:hypothetical protein